MMRHRPIVSSVVATCLFAGAASAIEPSNNELRAAGAWVRGTLESRTAASLPFSFRYGGKSSGSLIGSWKRDVRMRTLDSGRRERTVSLIDPATALEVRCLATTFDDFPAVEWMLTFKNGGQADTPILADIQALDARFGPGSPGRRFKLYHAAGSRALVNDFQPRQTELGENGLLNLASSGGRSSDGNLPFFNLAFPGGGGVALAIGWTGQWAASFRSLMQGRIQIRAGMESVHTILHPGEEIRSPSILVVFWIGQERMRGQNLLRRFLLTRESPTIDGKPVNPPCAASVHGYLGFESTTEANVLTGLENVKNHGVPFDTWWIDAGWFTCGSNWARYVGNLDPDPARFPNGLKPIADAAHKAGMRFLLWFEPERVMPDTQVFKEHPEWLLKPATDMPRELNYQIKDGFHLLDLGNPDALAWIKKRLSATIASVGIDCYRNDFNMYPLYYWRNQEPADRRGMREIRYVSGLYDLFDSLRKEHPRLLLDNCASGGRRIDLEMLRRALVLTRSDYLWDPIGQQCHTYGLAQWIPITGIGAASLDRYCCRSGLGSHYTLAADYRSADPAIWKAIGQAVAEQRTLEPFYRGDFYPLGSYSTEPIAWMAWQYHRADLGAGLVQAFRRQNSTDSFAVYHLRGLEPDARYIVKNLDHARTRETTGRKLIQEGLIISLPSKPDAAVITYKKAG
jgi:alpha-galactosidase